YTKSGKDPEKGMIMYATPAETEPTPTTNADDDTLAEDPAMIARVYAVVARAKAAMPGYETKITDAMDIVLGGDVRLGEKPHTYLVRSQSRSDVWHHINGVCTCDDAKKGQAKYCKHRLAVYLWRRLNEPTQGTTPAPIGGATIETPPDTQGARGLSEVESAILQRYTYKRGDTEAIRYAGLLLVARLRGLSSLKETWTYNDADLSLAEAHACFQDGTEWQGSGDATPTNVEKRLAPAFRRMALTRAKARCLRDALGIDMVALEELGE